MFLIEEVQKLDRSARWNYAFQVLNLETRKVVEDFTLKAARLPEHRNLNRYRDVLPYDHSRVELHGGDTSYVNANTVEVKEIGRKYILTQGPLPDTCSHFWQMVWEQNCGTIIMLNKVIEKNAVKCHPYWPMGEDEIHEYGDYRVRNQSERAETAYVVRELILEHLPTDETRNIKQFHYMLWPDFGVPSKAETFLDFLYDIRDSGSFEDSQGPPVIHCSAGIGRSGTFCLVDSVLLKAEIDGKPDNIDVKDMLLHLRKYRVGLVQTPEQLRFSYLAIIQGIANIYPEIFNIVDDKNDESNKRKADNEDGDEEPPPIPPRKRAPPEKPPRRLENTETTAAEESLKQKKLVKNLRDGIVDGSSDEDGSDEEVLDLSASEDEKDDLLELFESEDEPALDSKTESHLPPSVPECDYVEKPLPPIPTVAEKDCLEPVQKYESHDDKNSEPDEGRDVSQKFSEKSEYKPTTNNDVEKDNNSLPLFTSEDETEGSDVFRQQQQTLSETIMYPSQSQSVNEESNKSSDTCQPVASQVNSIDSGDRANEEESHVKYETEDDKARKERELRQRIRRDEKNKQTTEMIEKIKKKMQHQEIAAARNAFLKKSLIAVGISAVLLLGYYWLVA